MIQELSKAFRRLINSLSVRPLPTLGALFIVCSGFVGYQSYHTLEKLVVTPEKEAARFKQQLESSKLVNQSIEQLRVGLRADVVIVKQFHNGRHDLTGIPFTEATDTYYTDGYDEDGEESLSTMNGMLRKMWTRIDAPECALVQAPIDSSTRKLFNRYSLNTVVACPITNILNYPIGVVEVGFRDLTNTHEDKVALERTSAISKSIAGYLKHTEGT